MIPSGWPQLFQVMEHDVEYNLIKEFVIDYWNLEMNDRVTVFGRCGDIPIRVSDTFDAVYSYHPRAYPEGLADPPELDQLIPVSLTVECIHAYELSLPEIGQCMTGSLVLVGTGLRRVAPGWVLGLQSSFAVPPR